MSNLENLLIINYDNYYYYYIKIMNTFYLMNASTIFL